MSNSLLYQEKAKLYEKLSQAEDKPGKILKKLIPHIQGKTVLDFGCGTGKYLSLLAPHAKKIIGVDKSIHVLDIARSKISHHSNIKLIHTNGQSIHLPDDHIDVTIGCWVLGTISNINQRQIALQEIQRVTTPLGQIILIENAPNSEFEQLRGRMNDPRERTQNYCNWIKKKGFTHLSTIKTHFQFDSLIEAQTTFKTIWPKTSKPEIESNQIKHQVDLWTLRTC